VRHRGSHIAHTHRHCTTGLTQCQHSPPPLHPASHSANTHRRCTPPHTVPTLTAAALGHSAHSNLCTAWCVCRRVRSALDAQLHELQGQAHEREQRAAAATLADAQKQRDIRIASLHARSARRFLNAALAEGWAAWTEHTDVRTRPSRSLLTESLTRGCTLTESLSLSHTDARGCCTPKLPTLTRRPAAAHVACACP
jgi:hypothetical protein